MLVLRESIATVVARQQRRSIPTLPFLVLWTVDSLMLLTAADEALTILLLLTPTSLLAAMHPPHALGALAIELRALLPPFRLRGSGLGLVVPAPSFQPMVF